VQIKQPGMARRCLIAHRLARAQHAKHRVVKLLGVFEMVSADHDMAKHGVPPVTHTGKIWA
jgi:hypothetical protein